MDASRRGKGRPSRTPAGCPAPSGVGSVSRRRARAPGPLPSCHRPLHKLSRPLAAEEALRAGSPGALLGSEFVTPAPGGPVPLRSGSEADQADVAFGVRLNPEQSLHPRPSPLHLRVGFGLFISNVVVKNTPVLELLRIKCR